MQPQPPTSTLLALAPGESLCDRYRLDRILGEGGMGVVWLATDTRLSRPVALKVLPTALSRDRRSIDRLKVEAGRNLDLTHEHIVRLNTFEQDPARGDIAFLVMQFVQGRTLHDLLADFPTGIPLDRVRPWADQIARAIDHAHAKGILHRDIKPSNIIIESTTDSAYLMDFGIAREAKDTMTRLTGRDSSGTLPYMSPQQLLGQNDRSNDIYSFAATLYESLSGRPPFVTGDLPTQIRLAPPPPLSNLPADIAHAIARGLSKEPADRPARCADLFGPPTPHQAAPSHKPRPDPRDRALPASRPVAPSADRVTLRSTLPFVAGRSVRGLSETFRRLTDNPQYSPAVRPFVAVARALLLTFRCVCLAVGILYGSASLNDVLFELPPLRGIPTGCFALPPVLISLFWALRPPIGRFAALRILMLAVGVWLLLYVTLSKSSFDRTSAFLMAFMGASLFHIFWELAHPFTARTLRRSAFLACGSFIYAAGVALYGHTGLRALAFYLPILGIALAAAPWCLTLLKHVTSNKARRAVPAPPNPPPAP